MEFRTITKKIADKFKLDMPAINETLVPSDSVITAPEAVAFDTSSYDCVTDLDALNRWIEDAYSTGYVAVDTETTSLDEMQAELVGISLCINAGKACYIPLTHKDGASDDLFGSSKLAGGQCDLNAALALIKPMLEDPSVLKIGQNMKYDAKIFANYGITIAPIDDTMLMSYAMHGGLHGHGMDALSQRYLNHEPISIKSLLGAGKAITLTVFQLEEATKYAAEDADITLRLWDMFKPVHQSKVTPVYEGLERPLIPVLAQMERTGIQVDRETLSRMSNAFAQKMASLEAEIHALAGETFNVGSPKQLGEIMFDKLDMKAVKKARTVLMRQAQISSKILQPLTNFRGVS